MYSRVEKIRSRERKGNKKEKEKGEKSLDFKCSFLRVKVSFSRFIAFKGEIVILKRDKHRRCPLKTWRDRIKGGGSKEMHETHLYPMRFVKISSWKNQILIYFQLF